LRYILSLDEIGHAIRFDQIKRVANAILIKNYTDNRLAPSIGQYWTQRFLKRHPKLYKAKQKPLDLKRKLAYNPDILSN
jgi:Tc5 transposase DNA-binding domain